MARNIRKCRWCKVSSPKEEMVVEYVGKKKTPRYYHEHCYQEYLKDKEFKERERRELGKLIEVIKQIYGVKTVPKSVYPYLQDLRNGTQFFGRYGYKYKQGYPYDLIAETFEYCSETIQYWLSVKKFDGFMGAFKYGLAIIADKLPIVEQRRKQREKERKLIARHIEQIQGYEFETSYRRSSNTVDISRFLDD